MISVVVPIYNEEVLILQFHEAISNALEETNEDWEVVYVNDGSRDSSLEILRGLQASDPHVVVVELSRNWGHMGAISAGLLTARGDAAVIMDGDFQDPPEVVPELVDAWRPALRWWSRCEEAVRNGASSGQAVSVFSIACWERYRTIPFPRCRNFRSLNRQAVDSINGLRERNRYLPGLRAWVGYKNAVVYYDRQDRVGRRWQAVVPEPHQVCDGCDHKLQLQASATLFPSGWVFEFLLRVFSEYRRYFRRIPFHSAGFGVASAVFMVGSMLLLCMGVLGEYLGRVYDEVRGRPLSIINRVYSSSEMMPVQADSAYEEMKPAGGFGVHVA